jgi:hypothetical protein
MPRPRIITQPTDTPTEADIIWAAAMFEMRGRSLTQNWIVYLQINFKSGDPTPLRLQRFFGGRVYEFGIQSRWQIIDELRDNFLQAITPYVGAIGYAKIAEIRETVQAGEKIRKIKAASRQSAVEKLKAEAAAADDVLASPKADLFHLPDPFDIDVVEISLPILLGDDIDDPQAVITCKAKTEGSATHYAKALMEAGFVVAHKGVLLAVGRKPTGAVKHEEKLRENRAKYL